MKTLILSDMHLGTQASKAASYLDGIRTAARNYDRVILNGDTLDRYEKPDCVDSAKRHLGDALDACSSRNGPPELICGNHDPVISGDQWIYDEPSATLVFHGDCIADCTHPTRITDQLLMVRLQQRWKEMGGRPTRFPELIRMHRSIQAEFALEYPPGKVSRTFLSYVMSTLYPPQRPFHILRYWAGAPRLAAMLGLTHDKPVRHIVVGHTHRAGSWSIKNTHVFNTGSFMPLSVPNVVLIDGGAVKFMPLETLLRSSRAWSLPSTPLVRQPDKVQA